jgi:hypothetical protein
LAAGRAAHSTPPRVASPPISTSLADPETVRCAVLNLARQGTDARRVCSGARVQIGAGCVARTETARPKGRSHRLEAEPRDVARGHVRSALLRGSGLSALVGPRGAPADAGSSIREGARGIAGTARGWSARMLSPRPVGMYEVEQGREEVTWRHRFSSSSKSRCVHSFPPGYARPQVTDQGASRRCLGARAQCRVGVTSGTLVEDRSNGRALGQASARPRIRAHPRISGTPLRDRHTEGCAALRRVAKRPVI